MKPEEEKGDNFRMKNVKYKDPAVRIQQESERDMYSTMETSHGKGKEEGLKEGKEQGLAEGREQGLAEGREQGLKEGKEQGRQEEKIAMARTMKALSLPIETIIQVTGLSSDEVEYLS